MKFLFLIIIVLAFALRFINLGSVPPSLNWDEVSHGYNAYSILKTGSDEWGQFLPLTNFRAYGDYPLPLYMNLVMPFVAIFGLSEFVIRIPSALLGSLTVIVVYFLSKEIFKNKYAALLSVFLLAISPWGVLPSRQVIQSTPAIFFLALSFWLLLKGLSGRWIFNILGTLSIGLSAYAYHNTRILAPVLLIFFCFVFRKEIFTNIKKYILPAIIILIFFIPLIPVVFSSEGTARVSWVSIIDQGAINQINEQRNLSALPEPLPKLIYNRPVYFLTKFSENYFGYFNPVYLGFEGGTHYQFSIPHFGIVYPIELPFFYLGLIFLLIKGWKLDNKKKFFLGWLFLAPIPAAITRDPDQVIRSTIMIVSVYITTGYGFIKIAEYLKNKSRYFLILLLGVFLFCEFILVARYFNDLWFVYPKQYSFAWQYGYKEAAEYVQVNYSKYPRIVITKKYGEPHEFFLFYLKYNPYNYQHDVNLVRYERSQWFWVDRFDKFEFINDWEIKDKLLGVHQTLLITSPNNYPPGGRIVKTINFLNGDRAFEIVAID